MSAKGESDTAGVGVADEVELRRTRGTEARGGEERANDAARAEV